MVAHPSAPTTPIPLHAPGRRVQRLPLQPTPLIGRAAEIAALRARLLDPTVRLLTLTGPPGTGKTRLALATVEEVAGAFDDGVCFVGLESIGEPDGVVAAIAQALGVRESAGESLDAALMAALAGRHLLLVLDNFEQVLAAGAHVAALLGTCPELTVLVTSRVSLRLRWEHELPVTPLALPDRGRLFDPAVIVEATAVQLFVQRARALSPDFQFSAANAADVAAVCWALDGLPLAIELAAGRVKLLTPRAINERLHQRLQFLTGGPRDLPARQQTLRTALAWSYDLLTPDQQALFRRLGVFAGGFDVAAATAVAAAVPGSTFQVPSEAGSPLEPGTLNLELTVEDGLATLLDGSLISIAPVPDGEPRYRMLETLREYALEQLAAAGELEEIQRRHAAFFLQLAEAAQPQLQVGGQQAAWLGRLEAEHDNLRTALAWATAADGGAETAVRLSGALYRFWAQRGYVNEARQWLDRALAVSAEAPARGRMKALNAAGLFARQQRDFERAAALHDECLRLARQSNDLRSIAVSYHNLALVAQHGRADYAGALALYEESLALWRELGDAWGISGGLNNLGGLAILTGDYAAAEAALKESLTLCRGLEDAQGIAHALGYLGVAALRQGNAGQAAALLAESLTQYAGVGDRPGVAQCLEELAEVAAAQGQPERAARLLGAAAALREAIAIPGDAADRAAVADTSAATRTALGEARFAAAWEAGWALSLEQSVAEAHSGRDEGGGMRDESATDTGASSLPSGLTAREVEVLRLLAGGHSNPEIAAALVLSIHTVERHTVNIYAKIGARGRADAIAFAHRHGLAG